MKFKNYERLTEDELEAAREYAERVGVSVGTIIRRMSGYGREL